MKKSTEIVSEFDSNIQFDFQVPDDLSQIELDEDQIIQVFNNIITNSIDSMPDGGLITVIAESIEITKKNNLPIKDGNYIKIIFRDTGKGINKKNISNIFDPYFTTKNIGTKKGEGLGLAIAHSIILNHNGLIDVESKTGEGTTFYIYLPL